MNTKYLFHSCVAAVVVMLTGCSTVIVERSSSIASTGAAYATTLQKVNEFALNESIDFVAHELATRPVAGSRVALETVASDLKKRQELVSTYGEFLSALGEYFSNLEAFAKYDAATANSKAIEGDVDKLNALQVQLKSTEISAAKKSAISGIVGLVSKQAHASALQARLEKDSVPIATALALSSALRDEQIAWVQKPDDLLRKLEWESNVVDPFTDAARVRPLPLAWEMSFSVLVKNAPKVKLLQDAKLAGEKMETGWRDVLRGSYSLEEVRKSLADIQSGLDVLIKAKSAK